MMVWRHFYWLLWLGTLGGCTHLATFESSGSFEFLPAIPSRNSNAPTGSQLVRSLAPMSLEMRERTVLRELRRGNVPDFLRHGVPVTYDAIDSLGKKHRVSVGVLPDYLAIGSNGDFLRIPMTPITAQKIADQYGMLLPTKRLVDEIYRQAPMKLPPRPMPAGSSMVSMDFYMRHNQTIRDQLGSAEGGAKIVAGHKKDIVLTNRLLEARNRVAIYGWHRSATDPIQPLSIVHSFTYADYSHGIRLVHPMALVDAQPWPLIEILEDPVLSRLVSDEGRLRLTRAVGDCR